MDFTVAGDIRFLAHSDMLRLFGRAAARAGLPVHHSAGFNPHPQISLPLPRSVGVASLAERVIVGLDEPLPSDEVVRRMSAQMPDGITMTGGQALPGATSPVPVRVDYRVTAAADPPAVEQRIEQLMAASEWPIERRSPKHRTGKTIDLRPYIETLVLAQAPLGEHSEPQTLPASVGLHMRLRVTPAGSARPTEICNALGIQTGQIRLICRTEVEWQ